MLSVTLVSMSLMSSVRIASASISSSEESYLSKRKTHRCCGSRKVELSECEWPQVSVVGCPGIGKA